MGHDRDMAKENLKPKFLRRYTKFSSLIHILRTSSITLLSPKLWDDKNDSHFLNKYAEITSYKSILALCFTTASERSHHWGIFAPGHDGVCIQFNWDALIRQIEPMGIMHGRVVYKRIDKAEVETKNEDELIFLKRLPYKAEREYRIIILDKYDEINNKSIEIDLEATIQRIILSPYLPEELAGPMKKAVRLACEGKKIQIYRSTLFKNERWMRIAKRFSS